MRAALDIALKDLRQKIRDRSALLISVVAPFVLAALFSLILGGLDEDFSARWGYVDLDGGTIAQALDEAFDIEVRDEDLTVDLFHSISTLAGYVRQQLRGRLGAQQ